MEQKKSIFNSGIYLGVDVGSTTIKLALFKDNELIYKTYQRHLSMIKSKVLGELKKRCRNIIRLDKNYRSPKYLLDIFNEYAIKQLNVDAELLPKPKDDISASPEELKLVICNENSEKEFLSNEIHNLCKENGRTAILVAWNRDAAHFSSILKHCGIQHFRTKIHTKC